MSLRTKLSSQLSTLWAEVSSIWFNLDALTCSTWYLDKNDLSQWVRSNQQNAMVPRIRHPYRLHLLNWWLAVNVMRLAVYTAIYGHFHEVVVDGLRVELRFPYYFGDWYQLVSTFSLYAYMGGGGDIFFCVLCTSQFHLKRYLKNTSRWLQWYSMFLYIDSMTTQSKGYDRNRLYLLRQVSNRQYARYCQKFHRALWFQGMIVMNNYVVGAIVFVVVMFLVVMHPEWNYPILPSLLIDAWGQVLYIVMFKLTLCMLMIFYLNSIFVTMLLDSIEELLEVRGMPKRVVLKRTVHLFDQCFRMVGHVNRFWMDKLALYYLLLTPSMMICLYVILFVRVNLAFFVVYLYVCLVFMFSIHWLNLVASQVRSTALRIYRRLYHHNYVWHGNVQTRLKLSNTLTMLASKTDKFGIRIGKIGISEKRAAIVIMIVNLRLFMFATKLAKNMR